MLANILQVNSNDVIDQNIHSLKETAITPQVHQFIRQNTPDEKIIKIFDENEFLLLSL